MLCRDMQRSFALRVAFSPTRLSAEHLRSAYEVVTPVIERTIAITDAGEVDAVYERRRVRQESRKRAR
jgi:hypothetical protein